MKYPWKNLTISRVTSKLIDTKFISKMNQTMTETQQLLAKLY